MGGDTPGGNYGMARSSGGIGSANRGESSLAGLMMPVRYDNGAVTESMTDLSLPGPLFGWSQTRSYDSQTTNASVTQLGRNWISGNGDMRLVQSGSDVKCLAGASCTRTFTYNSGTSTYSSQGGNDLTLVASGSYLVLTNTVSGDLYYFWNFSQGTKSGLLDERTTRNWKAVSGNVGQKYYYDTSGRVTSITTATGQEESIAFTYVGTSFSISNIKVGPSGSPFMQVEYTYGADVTHSSDVGASNDLIQVKVSRKASDGTNWIVRYTQYRYQSDGKLKSVFEPDAIQRALTSYMLSSPSDLFAKADNFDNSGASPQLKAFASRSFLYHTSNEDTSSYQSVYGGTGVNEIGYVKSETVNGACDSCAGGGAAGGVTYEYHYMVTSNSSNDVNVAKKIVVEDVKDATGTTLIRRNLYSLNNDGRLLRKANVATAAGTTFWCQSWIYTTNNRVTEARSPSAHVITGFSISTFLDPYNGTTWTDTLSADGQITLYEYNSSGWPTGVRVKQGPSGTAYYVSATDYAIDDGTSTAAAQEVIATYEYPQQTTTRTDSSANKTAYTYTYYDSGKQQIETKTTARQAVPASANGPNVAAATEEVYNTQGQLIWVLDAEAYLTSYAYDSYTGQADQIVRDAAAATGSPSRGSGLPTPLALTTSLTYDTQSRLTRSIDPNHQGDSADHSDYTVYLSDRVVRFPSWDAGTSKALLPVEVTLIDNGEQITDRYTLDPTTITYNTSASQPTSVASEAQTDMVRWTHRAYDPAHAQLSELRRYHLIPSSGVGSEFTNYYSTTYTYDDEGRVLKTLSSVSSISGTNRRQESDAVYDFLGRVMQTKKVAQTGSDTPVKTRDITYDGGSVGDGYMTKVKDFFGTGTSDFSTTAFYYTYRGHLRGAEPQDASATVVPPVSLYDVDWMGRRTATAQLSASPTWSAIVADPTTTGYATQAALTSSVSNRLTLTTTSYDPQGRVYRSEAYRINQSTGALVNSGDRLRSDTYYDRVGRKVAQIVYNQAATETVYDGAGRMYQTRTVKTLVGGASDGSGTFYDATTHQFLYRNPQPAPSFGSAAATAMSGGNDQMIQLAHRLLDAGGDTLETHSFEVNHDDTDGLNIAETGSGTRDYVRHSVYKWFDGADRATTTADYGSGDTASGPGDWKYAAMPSRGTAPTGSSAAVLVTTLTYDRAGRLEKVIRDQNAGASLTQKSFYDDLGRTRYVVRNFVDFSWIPASNAVSGSGDSTNHNSDQAMSWDYNGFDQATKYTALDRNGDGTTTSGDDEVTQYQYTDAYDAALATKVIYPDSTGSGDDVTIAYALDGLPTSRTDQRGTVLTYGYDGLRRAQAETASTLGGADGTIRRIGRAYDTTGRLFTVTSYSDTAGSTVKNQIQYDYDDFGQLTKSWQDHDSAKGSGTPAVTYTNDYTPSSNLITSAGRTSQVAYPSGRTVGYTYGSSGTFDRALSRVTAITDPTPFNIAEYKYNGVGRLAQVDYAAQSPKLTLSYFDGTNPGYARLDRFGRVKTQVWIGGLSHTAAEDQFDYSYDYLGNRTQRDLPSGTLDQIYTYDGLNRLNLYKEGTIASGTIASPTKEADWTLDALGNWGGYAELTAGTPSLTQTRGHNAANEITSFSNSVGTGWTSPPTHDAAGNLTAAPSPLAPSDSGKDQAYTWDSWNRLVEVKHSTTSLAKFAYDGLHRRISKTVGTTVFDYYLSESNQVLEEQETDGGDDPFVRNEFVWHPFYVDALAWRMSADAGSSFFYSFDANFNVTAAYDQGAGSDGAAERYHYTPYGQVKFLDDSFAPLSGNVTAINQETLYTGRQFDPETGIYFYRARYYHSTLGRFIGRDPIGYNGGDGNLYRYVGDNPVNAVDPTGQFSWFNPPPGPRPNQPNKKNPYPHLGLGGVFCTPKKCRINNSGVITPLPPGTTFPIAPGAGTNTINAPPAPGTLVGTGGAAPCIALIVQCPGSVGVYHFTPGDAPSPTLNPYWFNIDYSACSGIVCGGDDSMLSNCLADAVISSVKEAGIKLDGVTGSPNCGWDGTGWYNTSYSWPAKYPP